MRVLVWSRGDSEWFLKGTDGGACGGLVAQWTRGVGLWIAMGRLVGCVRGWSRGVLVIAGEREDSRRGLHPMHCKPTL